MSNIYMRVSQVDSRVDFLQEKLEAQEKEIDELNKRAKETAILTLRMSAITERMVHKVLELEANLKNSTQTLHN